MASVSQTKQLTFLCEVRYKGVKVSKVFFDEREAHEWGNETEQQIDDGKLTPTEVVITLSKALDRYLKRYTSKKRSERVEKYRIKGLQRESFAKKRLNQITPKMIADYRDRRLEDVGDQTVRHDLNLIGHLYKKAISEWGINTPNPMIDLEKPEMPPARTRRINAVEKAKFVAAVNAYVEGGIEFQQFVLWQLATAMRKTESLEMTWNDIDFDRRYVYLPTSKNGDACNVPVSPAALRIIQQCRMNPFKPFQTLTEFHIRYHWKRLLKKVGITNYRVHDMRRECLSTMNEMGMSASDIQKISRHKSLAMIQRYCVVDEQKLISKLAQIAP